VIPELDATVDGEEGQARDRLLGQGLLRPGQEARRAQVDDVAIIRVEQLYPFPHKAFQAEMKKYPNATEIVWCQDEPQNQGAWFFVQHYIHENMLEGQKLGYAGRPASASPAVGYAPPAPGAAEGAARAGLRKLKGFVLTK
jgi:2-oxoglutarate dehydrogenase E1 component